MVDKQNLILSFLQILFSPLIINYFIIKMYVYFLNWKNFTQFTPKKALLIGVN